jgi:hypothetical protein
LSTIIPPRDYRQRFLAYITQNVFHKEDTENDRKLNEVGEQAAENTAILAEKKAKEAEASQKYDEIEEAETVDSAGIMPLMEAPGAERKLPNEGSADGISKHPSKQDLNSSISSNDSGDHFESLQKYVKKAAVEARKATEAASGSQAVGVEASVHAGHKADESAPSSSAGHHPAESSSADHKSDTLVHKTETTS